MKSNNKGFTLMELIISVAILGIMTSITVGFLHSGTKMHSSVSRQVNLQYQSQLAMNHIREYVVDGNTAISFKDETLYIINSTTSPAIYTAHIFKKTDDEIYYSKKEATFDEVGKKVTLNDDVLTDELLTDSVELFLVTLVGDTENNVDLATVDINFSALGKKYDGKMEIALRNKPLEAMVN